jgi:hypothetical protein
MSPSEDWSLSVDGALTMSEASFDPIQLELPERTVAIADYDFSKIPEYSDLEVTQLEISGRATRDISEHTSFYVGAAYYDLDDKAPYTYGDMSGSATYAYSGLRIQF